MTTSFAMTRLDAKLAAIRRDPFGTDAFILCDARDPDMARGIHAFGAVRIAGGARRPKSRAEFLGEVRDVVAQGIVDLVLLSPLNLHRLAVVERVFDGSAVARAARVNDTTEIWLPRHGAYRQSASRPFRSADLARVMAHGGADLGLYSVTFVNDVEADHCTLSAYNDFRAECNARGFRHFLEVFNPNVGRYATEEVGAFVNDSIVRCLAGVDRDAAPIFLKVAFNGRRAMSELVAYDEEMIVGVLGGAAGTTRDALELLHQAKGCGARLALFGRKINAAEAPLVLIEILRMTADGQIAPEEGVALYHDRLAKAGVAPDRPFAQDRLITDPVLMG